MVMRQAIFDGVTKRSLSEEFTADVLLSEGDDADGNGFYVVRAVRSVPKRPATPSRFVRMQRGSGTKISPLALCTCTQQFGRPRSMLGGSGVNGNVTATDVVGCD